MPQGMARAAGFNNIADGHRRVMKDLNEVFACIATFVQAYFYAALAKYNSELGAEVCSNITGAGSDSVVSSTSLGHHGTANKGSRWPRPPIPRIAATAPGIARVWRGAH
jgi:hypothetical protein